MSEFERKNSNLTESVNTVLTGLLVLGIGWLLLEVTSGREKWARMEERLATQQVNIMELRLDITQWNSNLKENEVFMREMERRVHVLENRVEYGKVYTPEDIYK